jgi:uncharacterized protein YqgQ
MAILSKTKLEEIAMINFEESKKYTRDVLEKRRNDYFNCIKECIQKEGEKA